MQNFSQLIKSEDFNKAFKLIENFIYECEDLMDQISDKEYEKLEPHWSAVQTGEQISTPLKVLKKISDKANFTAGKSLIDIGSGHGLPSFVFKSLNPKLNIIGYELIKEKVKAAIDCASFLNMNDLKFYCQDLSDSNFSVPQADYYYLYNPLNLETAEKVCNEIAKNSLKQNCIIITTNGRDLPLFLNKGFKIKKELLDLGVSFLER